MDNARSRDFISFVDESKQKLHIAFVLNVNNHGATNLFANNILTSRWYSLSKWERKNLNERYPFVTRTLLILPAHGEPFDKKDISTFWDQGIKYIWPGDLTPDEAIEKSKIAVIKNTHVGLSVDVEYVEIRSGGRIVCEARQESIRVVESLLRKSGAMGILDEQIGLVLANHNKIKVPQAKTGFFWTDNQGKAMAAPIVRLNITGADGRRSVDANERDGATLYSIIKPR